MARDLIKTGFSGSGDPQADIDEHVSALSGVLEQESIMDVLDWVADYAQTASRVKVGEDVDYHFDVILEHMKSYGYGQQDDHATALEQSALKIIANTMARMESGQAPTGYERIFADQLIKEMQKSELNVATPV